MRMVVVSVMMVMMRVLMGRRVVGSGDAASIWYSKICMHLGTLFASCQQVQSMADHPSTEKGT